MEEIQDHCYLPEKWSTNKDHSKAERVIVCEVANVPRVTSKQLKDFLTLANVNVHEPTIRRTLSNHGVHGRVARRKPLFSKKKSACWRSCGQARELLEKGLMDGWTQNRTYWFKWEAIMFGEKNTLHSSLRILSHLWSMVVVVSWLGPVLLHLGQDILPSLMEPWNSELYLQILKEFKNRVSRERGSCSKTTTPSTQVILPKNG